MKQQNGKATVISSHESCIHTFYRKKKKHKQMEKRRENEKKTHTHHIERLELLGCKRPDKDSEWH